MEIEIQIKKIAGKLHWDLVYKGQLIDIAELLLCIIQDVELAIHICRRLH